MLLVKHRFRPTDLVAGHIVLDFINTATGRNATPQDWLAGLSALLDWARRRAEFEVSDLDAMEQQVARYPSKAGAASARAVKLREALCRVIYSVVSGPDDQGVIESAYRSAMEAVRFDWSATACRLNWSMEKSGLDLVLHIVADHALSLFCTLDLDRLRVCAGDNCGWVFLDTSRNGRRRWCDMTTCGNVAKARRHYHRMRSV